MTHSFLISLLVILSLISPLDLRPSTFNFRTSTFDLRPSTYQLTVDFDPAVKRLTVKETLLWVNNGGVTAKEIYLHLYPNAYSSSASLYMQGMEVPPNSVTRIRLNTLTLSPSLPLLFPYAPDSTVAILDLSKTGGVAPGKSITLFIEYTLRIPEAFGRFGHSADQNLYWISQWYPKPGVFRDGKWECEPFFRNTEFFSDFASYLLTLTIPEGYKPVVPGECISREKLKDGKIKYIYSADNIHDLAWGALREYVPASAKYRKRGGGEVTVSAYLLPYNKVHSGRALLAVKNALSFLEREIGPYPYSDLAIVDVPNNAGLIASMEYPRVITYHTDYFIPSRGLQLEEVVIHEITHQYFYGIVANNEVKEAWLDESFANYLTTKILEEYYPPEMSYFKLFGYYPVPGFVLLEQAELPIVYTLSSYKVPFLSGSLSNYYRYPEAGSIASNSSLLAEWNHYAAISYSKGELLLHALEKQIGEKEFLHILSRYFTDYSWRHPSGADFWRYVKNGTTKDVSFLYENFYLGSGKVDYKITGISRTKDIVKVIIERSGEGIFPSEVVLYTSNGNLKQNWGGEERIKVLKFRTGGFVIGAEIDPGRKNPFDLNYANNSKMIEIQIMGSLSISLKWFFWMQNLLTLAGGLA